MFVGITELSTQNTSIISKYTHKFGALLSLFEPRISESEQAHGNLISKNLT